VQQGGSPEAISRPGRYSEKGKENQKISKTPKNQKDD
jgi:hypothetical protein